MWKDALWRSASIGAILIQYGCVAHCTLEFIGDFVVVSISLIFFQCFQSDINPFISLSEKKTKLQELAIYNSLFYLIYLFIYIYIVLYFYSVLDHQCNQQSIKMI